MEYSIDQLKEEWEEVYCITDFKEVSSEVYSEFWDAEYYQTYGGGPEGGYLIQQKDDKEIIYKVCRSWGEPWCITELKDAKLERAKYQHDKWNVSLYVKMSKSIQNQKSKKVCPFCTKEFLNVEAHIVKTHKLCKVICCGTYEPIDKVISDLGGTYIGKKTNHSMCERCWT